MRYFIDTEFDGFGGPLLSMAIIREDGRSIYFTPLGAIEQARDPWVLEHVIPHMHNSPEPCRQASRAGAIGGILHLMNGDPAPEFVADWPDDLRHLCDLLITGPGAMAPLPSFAMRVERCEPYDDPRANPIAVRHCAWWDAMVLMEHLSRDAAETNQ